MSQEARDFHEHFDARVNLCVVSDVELLSLLCLVALNGLRSSAHASAKNNYNGGPELECNPKNLIPLCINGMDPSRPRVLTSYSICGVALSLNRSSFHLEPVM